MAFRELTPQQKKKFDQSVKIQLATNGVFRVSGGLVYNIVSDDRWKEVSGIVSFTAENKLVLRETVDGFETSRYISLTNAPFHAFGERVHHLAIRVGTANLNGFPTEVWDCGAIYVPAPPTPQQIKTAQKDAAIRQQSEQLARKNSSAKTLKWNQDQAAAGDEYAELRMGERYRDGDGVPKDISKARDYLSKSAAQGDKTAKEELNALSAYTP